MYKMRRAPLAGKWCHVSTRIGTHHLILFLIFYHQYHTLCLAETVLIIYHNLNNSLANVDFSSSIAPPLQKRQQKFPVVGGGPLDRSNYPNSTGQKSGDLATTARQKKYLLLSSSSSSSCSICRQPLFHDQMMTKYDNRNDASSHR